MFKKAKPESQIKGDKTLEALPAVLAQFERDGDKLKVCAMALLPRVVTAAMAVLTPVVTTALWWWLRSP